MLEEKRETRDYELYEEREGRDNRNGRDVHGPQQGTPRPRAKPGRRAVRRRRLNPRFVILCAAGALLVCLLLTRLLGGGSEEPKDPTLPDYVQEDLLTVNEWSRPGDLLKEVNYVVIHYVGNPGTTAQANRNYFESLSTGADNTYASSHFVVGLEGEVVQCVPLTEIAYASNSRNADSISIEVCHPDAEGEFSDASYKRCVELTAWLCQQYDLKPKDAVIRHYDVTGKQCPLYYVEHPDAWDAFLADVEKAVKAK